MSVDFSDLRELELLGAVHQQEDEVTAAERELEQRIADFCVLEAEWMAAEDRYAQAQRDAWPLMQAAKDDEKQVGWVIDVQFQMEHPQAWAAWNAMQEADKQRGEASGRMTNAAMARQDAESRVTLQHDELGGVVAALAEYRQQRDQRLAKLHERGTLSDLVRRVRGVS